MTSMFSLFCGPKKLSEEDEDTNAIEYLESKSLTFDTLETDGTDGSSPKSFHKNANCESLLGTLVGDTQDTTMVDEPIMREDGECRESVPSGEPNESTSPGLSPDLPAPDCAEGPDMPKSDKDKRKVGYLSPLSSASDLKISESTSTGVCQGDEGGENDRGVTSDTVSMDKTVAEDPVDDLKRDSDSNNIPQNVEEEEFGTTDVETDCLAPSTDDVAVLPSSAAKASSPRLTKEEIPLHSVASSNEQAHRNIDSNSKEECDEASSWVSQSNNFRQVLYRRQTRMNLTKMTRMISAKSRMRMKYAGSHQTPLFACHYRYDCLTCRERISTR